MKLPFRVASRILAGCLLVVVACAWAWSYRAAHSLQCSRASGEVLVLADRGILQVDFVRGDTGDRGFWWDDYRREMFWGRALLDLEKPKNGFAGLLADFGFASWSYDRDLSFVDSALPGRAVFMPLWFLALIVVLPALIELIVVLRRRRPGPTTSGMSAG